MPLVCPRGAAGAAACSAAPGVGEMEEDAGGGGWTAPTGGGAIAPLEGIKGTAPVGGGGRLLPRAGGGGTDVGGGAIWPPVGRKGLGPLPVGVLCGVGIEGAGTGLVEPPDVLDYRVT